MMPLVKIPGYYAPSDYGGSVWVNTDITYFKTDEGTIVRQENYTRPVGCLTALKRWLRGEKREDYIAMTDSDPMSDSLAVRWLMRETGEKSGVVAKWLRLEHDPLKPKVL